MSRDLGEMPEPQTDEPQRVAAGGLDAAPTSKDLSYPRDEPPLTADQPRAAQTPDKAIPDGITSERRLEQQRADLEDD